MQLVLLFFSSVSVDGVHLYVCVFISLSLCASQSIPAFAISSGNLNSKYVDQFFNYFYLYPVSPRTLWSLLFSHLRLRQSTGQFTLICE